MRTRALESALVTAGIRTFRDETEIADGDAFPERIIDALLASRVVAVFADQVYFEREYCRWELEAALAPLRRDGAEDQSAALRHIVVARPADRRISDELDRLPPAIRSRQWPQANETDRLASLVCDLLATSGQTLAERLGATAATELRARLLEGSRVALPTLPGSVPRFPSVLPVSLRDAFVGRPEVLWRIDYLLRSRYGTLETVRPTVSIEGFGGVGKSRLALEYVHRYGQYYPGGLFWIDADTTPERREEQLHGILQALVPATPALVQLRKDNVDVAASVGHALCDIPSATPVLYVVDNLPEPCTGTGPEPMTRWCPAPGRVALLVSSRMRVSLAEGVDPIALPELGPEAAVALLTQNLDRASVPDPGWASIAEWVGRLPLALVLLNAALRARSLSASRLCNLAEAGAETTAALDRQMGALRNQVPVGSLRSITQAFALSYSLLPSVAQRLARLIAHLAPDPIPEALLRALGDDLASPEARTALVARSFVTAVSGTTAPNFGRMHRVLADFLRVQSATPEAELSALVDSLLTVLDPSALGDSSAWPVVNATIPHADAVLTEIAKFPGVTGGLADTSEMRARIATTLYAQGNLASARKLQEEVLATRRRIHGFEHPDTLDAANNLAVTAYGQGDLVFARTLQEQILADRRRLLGPMHASTFMAAGNLGNTLFGQGDFAGARALDVEVLAALRQGLGPEHPETLRAASNLANTMHAQGDLAGARRIQQDVFAALRQGLGPEHPETLRAASNLANTMHSQGDLASARTIQQDVFANRQRILGPEHPETLKAGNNLAITLHTQGELASARTLQEDLLDCSKRILGPEHPDTLDLANNLAATLYAQADKSGARRLWEQVFEVRRRMLGPEHPNTLSVANNLAITNDKGAGR